MDQGTGETAWGPKMLALPNDRWRLFVIYWLDGAPQGRSQGKGYTWAARKAGFCGNTSASMRSTAYQLAHDQRIQEAIQEEARKRMVSSVPAALNALEQVLDNPGHKDRVAAAKTILDRTGMHEVREVEHKHAFIADDPAMIEHVRQLAKRLNIPIEQLLGRTATQQLLPARTITDVQFEEVKDGEE